VPSDSSLGELTVQIEGAEAMAPRKGLIRFAVICDGLSIFEWQAQCLRTLMRVDNVRATLLLNIDATGLRHSSSGSTRGLPRLLRLYERWVARPRSLKRADLPSLLGDVPIIHCTTSSRSQDAGQFSPEDILNIKRFDLDFVLHFGTNQVFGEILSAAHYGVWSFYEDDLRHSGSPRCFWEIYNGELGVSAKLRRLTDRMGDGLTLRQGFLPTIGHSYAATLDRVLFESSAWPAQVCVDITNGNDAYLVGPPDSETSFHKAPNSFQILCFPFKLVGNFLARTYEHLFCHEEWNVGIIRAPASSFLETDVHPKIQWLPSPKKGRYLADPFAISKNHTTYILCEDFDYGPLKADISSIELTSGGAIGRKEVGIQEPFHLSYPYVFEHEGAFYCVPEASKARQVNLYKARHFPWSWEQVCTLLDDFPGIDSTIFQHGGRWWLTCTNLEEGKNYKLFVWYAKELTGPWQPHALNPVKLDVRSSRPGGTPFLHNGCLYRPAQDCSLTYGGRIVVNRVLQLTPTAFVEEPVKAIDPDPKSLYRDGLHTLSAAGDVTVIDGKRHLFQMQGFVHALRYMFR
jgi:hypothetical protein